MRDLLQLASGASGAAQGNAPVSRSQRWGNTEIASLRQKGSHRPEWGWKAAAHSRHSTQKRAYQEEGGGHVQRVTYHTAARRQSLDQWRLGDSWTGADELGGFGPHEPSPAHSYPSPLCPPCALCARATARYREPSSSSCCTLWHGRKKSLAAGPHHAGWRPPDPA